MSCNPSAELCYGVSLMSDDDKIIPGDQLNNLQETLYANKLSEFEVYSCYYNDWSFYVLAIKHKPDYFDCVEELGKTLPVTDPSWDKKLKDFCSANKIPFSEPQWWLLASYS